AEVACFGANEIDRLGHRHLLGKSTGIGALIAQVYSNHTFFVIFSNILFILPTPKSMQKA
ncbi:MAG: hypothetical protein IKF61_05035, partial [Firmicutes bacterium]|nr:hypothetical protein [Bacillota bacterium]